MFLTNLYLGAYYPAQPLYDVVLYSPLQCIVCVFKTGSFDRTFIFKNTSWGYHYVSLGIKNDEVIRLYILKDN